MVKIILCTTFRDFKGTDNDKIQYMFLENIKKQTYQNFVLVTTTFGEKNVKGVVDQYFGEKSITRNVDLPTNYRFSLTDVILSAIETAKNIAEDSIIIWCTCDIMFDSDFFQKLAYYYQKGISGIVHPNIIYKSIKDMNDDRNASVEIYKGIDLLFFDKNVLIDAEQDIINYRFYDWGVFEFFLVGISMVHSLNRINLFTQTQVKKIVNDRKLTNESKAYFERCLKMNEPIFRQYCTDKGLPPKLYDRGWLYDCHCQFKMIKPTFSYYKMKYSYAIYRYIYNSMKSLVSKVIVK